MTGFEKIAADWREQVARLEKSIELWEGGAIEVTSNGQDVTADHISLLREQIANLEQGIAVLERGMSATLPTMDAEIVSEWTDEQLLAAWKMSDWAPGDPRADALAAEIERRNLDF